MLVGKGRWAWKPFFFLQICFPFTQEFFEEGSGEESLNQTSLFLFYLRISLMHKVGEVGVSLIQFSWQLTLSR
jgi:hypothetical protein